MVHLEGTTVDEVMLLDEMDKSSNNLLYSIVISKIVAKAKDMMIHYGEEIVVKYSPEYLTFEK
jgi:hypothetical protein